MCKSCQEITQHKHWNSDSMNSSRTKKIRVSCTKCGARFIVDEKHGGRIGRCFQCDKRFPLPIPDSEKLIEWASSTSWKRLCQFIDMSGARGHSADVIDDLVEIANQRRWAKEYETLRAQSTDNRVLSRKEEAWERTERKLARVRLLDDLRSMEPYEFEEFVSDIFSTEGKTSRTVGGTSDGGIDVKVWNRDGKLWAVAQCKRYTEGNPVTASEIRDFAGAYLLSQAEKGFFITTSRYTKSARRTARGYPWLTLYSGSEFVRYIQQVNEQIKAAG